MLTQNRVVVTGVGVVAPNGIGKEAFWKTLLEGRSAIGPITLFDASQHPCRIAGEVKDFDPAIHIGPGINGRKVARQTQLALAATLLALQDASLSKDYLATQFPVPLLLGIGCAPMDIIEEGMTRLLQKGPTRVPSYTVHSGQPHHAASFVAQHFPLITQSTTISSACAAGLDAIALAADLIRRGKADVALCGGTDAPISSMTFACLAKTGLMSLRNDTPEKASRPFDLDRDSGVISEGAGMVILESLEHALGRGAHPYLEITGCSSLVDPDLDIPGCGLEDTMRGALANAGKRPADIDYICAHGPGHPVMDRLETAMIKAVFGDRAYRVPISSIKGVIGNPLAAAGALQIIACALAMQHDLIPPTANLEKPDPDCDLDYVPLTARHARMATALINAHGIGGGNSSMIVERINSIR
jgi:3-oxoacyl-[acyl-carrier-protein] synthase II